ncbi:MAG TPA: FAD-dependent oxidoreductase [Mycobacteriales bacterium]|nr:FAD-dependent oxidoreductase [Mycobacteriales bacterium]
MTTPPSMWLELCGDDLTPRPALPGSTSCDVAIVGAGFTGLWTAWHLLHQDPALRVVVLEREIAGWGASGRNGGWCSALFAASWSRVAADHGRPAALALRRALERTVVDVADWCTANSVDADVAVGGTLTLARGPAQVQRVRAHVDEDNASGGNDTVWFDAAQTAERIVVTGVDGAAFTPHCAAIQPAKLARGLAREVERIGGVVHERTAAVAVEPGLVRTQQGDIRADVVVQATEGYTAELPGRSRALVPVWSLIVATEPLPADVWSQIGWSGRETITDGRHLIIYAQRTADDRIVFGGRGAPYRFGSRTSGDRGHRRTFRRLEEELRTLFPAAAGARVTHRWGGVLGVPRDWMPSVGIDRATGLAWAGGYVGDGVGCSALAGRTLADLALGAETELTGLAWVGHRSPRWEPEPLRWAGVRGVNALMASADRVETRTGRPARRAAVVSRLVGE